MWGARVGSRRGARGLAALAAVVVTVSLLGVAQAGAQQNPPVNQPGVTASEIKVGGVGTVTGDPTGNNPGGPPSRVLRRTSTTSTGRRTRASVAASSSSLRSATTLSATTGKRSR